MRRDDGTLEGLKKGPSFFGTRLEASGLGRSEEACKNGRVNFEVWSQVRDKTVWKNVVIVEQKAS